LTHHIAHVSLHTTLFTGLLAYLRLDIIKLVHVVLHSFLPHRSQVYFDNDPRRGPRHRVSPGAPTLEEEEQEAWNIFEISLHIPTENQSVLHWRFLPGYSDVGTR
jgi:hypothetical protein